MATNNENRAAEILATVITVWVLSIFAIVLRFVARRVSRAPLKIDDWLALTAWVFFTPKAILFLVGVGLGGGQHQEVVVQANPNNLSEFLKVVWVADLMYPLSITFAKSSIICLYLRLFGTIRSLRWFCYGMLVIVVCWGIAILVATILQCLPVYSAWSPTPDMVCIQQQPFFLGSVIPDALLDVCILIAPLRPIWQLNLSKRKKFYVTFALLLGAIEIVFSIARLVIFTRLSLEDPTWNFSDAMIWTSAEEGMGVICVCLPVMAPLLRSRTRENTKASSYAMDSNPRTHQSDRFRRLESSSERALTASELEGGITKTTDFSVHGYQEYDDRPGRAM